MIVQELIDKLSELDPTLEVRVQYRDGGGDYDGSDAEVYLLVNNNKLYL